MKKIRNACVAAAVIGATALTTLRPASAWWGRPGPFFWGGVAAGAATGAVIGSSALAAPYRYGRILPLPALLDLVEWIRLGP